MGRGTTVAVAGVSVCLLGAILAETGPTGELLGILLGLLGVAISLGGALYEFTGTGPRQWRAYVRP